MSRTWILSRLSKVALLAILALLLLGCDKKKPTDEHAGHDHGTQDEEQETQASPEGRCEHDVTQALCTKCNPALIPVFRAKGDYCEEHGFAKSFCPKCNPDAKMPDLFEESPAADWCVEHSITESKCTKCSPALVEKFKKAGDYCQEHGFPKSACPTCNPETPPPGAEENAIEARVVRLRAPELEKIAGITTIDAKKADATSGVECTTQLEFDANRVADIRAIVPGVVRRIRVEHGDQVKVGTPLFDLESTRVSEIQGALQRAQERKRLAESTLKREQSLLAEQVTSRANVDIAEQELRSAEAEVRTAEASLRMAGAGSTTSGRYTLVSPIAGNVVRRPTVVGVLATENESLATIADTSVMWGVCDVSERDASRVALGQKVRVYTDADTQGIEGEITWIAAYVDEKTRTVAARAEIANADGRLRANQFARAHISTGTTQRAVTLPRDAVQRVGRREVVFVRTAPGVYEPRVVRRFGSGERVQVEGRIEEGEDVVLTGAVLLRTEILPGSIGAGCCEVGPPKDG